MRLRALAVAALVVLAGCSSDNKTAAPEPDPAPVETPVTVPETPVVITMVSPEMGSVQGSGGRGMVVVLTLTARDPNALPAQFRLGGELPPNPASAKPGRNPAIPGLVVGTTTTGPALGGPAANLANLFQIVSPAPQPDGSVKVTAIWTNTQAVFGSDSDVTLGAVTVSGTAPDTIPDPLSSLPINSNLAFSTFRISAATTPAIEASSTTSTPAATSTTVRRNTPTTSRPAANTTTTATVAPTTTTTRPAPVITTTVPPTTATTRFLGLF